MQMARMTGQVILIFGMSLSILCGCGELSDIDPHQTNEKRRSTPLPIQVWSEVETQDLAILLPRVQGDEITADTPTIDGQVLLSKIWMTQVGNAYLSTDVEDAFARDSTYEQWQVVAVRIAPCSPFGKIPGKQADLLCWPEVRLVWEPVLYDYLSEWMTTHVEAFSDDRAIHALYRAYPVEGQAEVDTMIRTLQMMEDQGRDVDRGYLEQFIRLRTRVIQELLGDVINLRDPNYGSAAYRNLDLRAETFGTDGERESFLSKLRVFLGEYAQPRALHGLTSFSLPEGEHPATVDIWVFLAFDGVDGQLQQRSIEVADPKTGKTIFDYGDAEIVAAAQPDHRVLDTIEDEDGDTRAIEAQILGHNSLDRFSLAEKINDPEQTLIGNTSCATCHNFNEMAFNFHSLSYFQELDMTIAPRVKNDVVHELKWLRTRR